MTYMEYLAVLLTAVAVIVTTLGVFVAVLALWGYSQFRKTARTAAKDFVATEINSGTLKRDIEALVVSHITKQLSSKRIRTLLEERVDRLIYSDASSRSKSTFTNTDEDDDADF